MRYGIVEDDIIVNVVIADEALAANYIQADIVDIGDRVVKGKIVKSIPVYEQALLKIKHRHPEIKHPQWEPEMREYIDSIPRDSSILEIVHKLKLITEKYL